MKIAISSESTADLTKELLEKYDIRILPFTVILGDSSGLDGEINSKEIFEYVARTKQLPKTSAINEFQYEEHFNKLLQEYDEVIHITLSSGISSAHNNARLAAETIGEKIHVIDSQSLSTGMGILAIHARELANEGLAPNEIVEKVKARVPAVQISFVLQNVDYLYKGGRCSKVAFLGANIFHICPQIIVKDGKMDAGKKYRGKFFDVVRQYVDDTLEQFNHPDLSHVFITYSSLDDEENIVNMIREKLVAKGFKDIKITYAGGTITSHCGPNTVGIIYINDK